MKRDQAVEVLFAGLDDAQTRTGILKCLGGLTILSNPKEYGLTYAFARDLESDVPAPFERRINGEMPMVNRIAVTASEKFDSDGTSSGTHFVFTATRIKRTIIN